MRFNRSSLMKSKMTTKNSRAYHGISYYMSNGIYIYAGYSFETDTFSKVWLRNDKASSGSNLASLRNDIRETQRVSVWATEKLSY